MPMKDPTSIMSGRMQGGDSLDGEEVGADARDLGAHLVEHLAELLDVGLAGGVVDGGGALGEDGGHDDVGGAGDAGFIQEHVGAAEFVGIDFIDAALDAVVELGAEVLVADVADGDVAAGHGCHADEGSDLDHVGQDFLTAQIFHVELVGLELPCVVAQLGDPYAHAAQQVDEVVDIKDVGHVADDDRLGGEQDG